MNNRTKLFIVLAVTGWIRVLFIVVPLAFVWLGINDKTNPIPITTNTGIVDSNGNTITP